MHHSQGLHHNMSMLTYAAMIAQLPACYTFETQFAMLSDRSCLALRQLPQTKCLAKHSQHAVQHVRH